MLVQWCAVQPDSVKVNPIVVFAGDDSHPFQENKQHIFVTSPILESHTITFILWIPNIINEAKMFLRKYISNFVPKGSIKGQPSKQKTTVGLTWALSGWGADACTWEMGSSTHQFLCKFDQKSIGVATWKLSIYFQPLLAYPPNF